MNKPKEKSKIHAHPSKPIDKERKEEVKNATMEKTRPLRILENAEVPTVASVTAGNWMAEIGKSNIRKNTLRIGDR